jgi:hypothetical protein
MAGSALVLLSCGGLQAEMARADRDDCHRVVVRYPVVSNDRGYAAVRSEDREGYKIHVAKCALSLEQFDLARTVAQGLSDRLAIERQPLVARASAGLKDDDAARTALEAYVDDELAEVDVIADSPELMRYRGQEWFVHLALRLYSRRGGESLHDFAKEFVGPVLPLRVAAADPNREPGSWAVWTGVVREARLDSKTDQTLLLAEGVDVKSEDMGVENVSSEERITGSAYSPRTYTARLETKATTHRFEEAFVPNGHNFMVRYPKARDSLAAMHTIVAFGHFVGRDPGGEMPVLEALIVRERKSERTVK